MKVTVLVGPQGSGKSTRCEYSRVEAGFGDGPIPFRVSQDEMGREYWKQYEQALKRKERWIIVDRINHTREQRRKILEAAKAAGYRTEILVRNKTFGTCFDRIMERKNHPTIKNKLSAIQALKMYFSQYQRPTPDEADCVNYESAYDPYLLDLNNIYPTGTKFIVIGDVHGCYDELVELLKEVAYVAGQDVVVFTGDLIDRGPKIREVLQFAINTPRVHCVLGNHENKLARHLTSTVAGLQSKVSISGEFKKTLDQCSDMLNEDLLGWLWSLPMIIKFEKTYVFHAGINPRYPITKQNNECLIYCRRIDLALNTFSNEAAPYWYEHPQHESLDGHTLLFGHEVREQKVVYISPKIDQRKGSTIIPMDGGCCFGEKLRALMDDQIIEVESKMPKTRYEAPYENWSEPYEERVKNGYLSRKETSELVLYNYTDKCAYEKAWDKYTLESRGIIFEKTTGKVVARPFNKFFNLRETPETQFESLPYEPYECFEKMDGSLGVVYCYKKKWNVATRGSFDSEQAQYAANMLQKYKMEVLNQNYTILTEIVYPENRHSPGARLVIDYGNTEFLCVLAIFDRSTGEEVPYSQVKELAEQAGMPVVKRYDHTIENMIALQKTLPADREGFVVRFKSGFRIKIKGEEYNKMHRILNSITPLFIWELMLDTPEFLVPTDYIMKVPEEYRHEVIEIAQKLRECRRNLLIEIDEDFYQTLRGAGLDIVDIVPPVTKELKARFGTYLHQVGLKEIKHSAAMFPRLLNIEDSLEKYVRKMIRPTANQL